MPPKGKKTKQQPPVASQAPLSSTTPDWPPLTPTLPTETLALTSLLPSQIYTTPLLPSSLCATYRHFLSTLPLLTTPAPKRNEATRVNDRYQTNSPTFAAHLFHTTGLATLLGSGPIDDAFPSASDRATLWGGTVLGLSDNIRIYRYRPGQFFNAHYDEANEVMLRREGGEVVKGRTTWTLLVYLSGPATGCVGGETVFYPEGRGRQGSRPQPVVAELSVGMALLHRHGRECLLHEGREVAQGEKWVIRSDLVVER